MATENLTYVQTLHDIKAHFLYIPDQPETFSFLVLHHPKVDTSGYYDHIYPAVHQDPRQ